MIGADERNARPPASFTGGNMRFKFNRKYTQIAFYAVAVIVVSGILLFWVNSSPEMPELLDFVVSAIAPIIWGIIIAYLLNPGVDFFRYRVFKKWGESAKSPKMHRVIKNLSIFIVFLLAIAALTGLVVLIAPQLVSSVSGLVTNFDSYSSEFLGWAKETFKDFPQVVEILENPISQIEVFLTNMWADFSPQILDFGSKVGSSILSFILGFKDFIIGFIIAVYLISSKSMLKSQAKKLLFALFKNDTAQKVISVSNRCNGIFSHYITGILIDAFFVGCATFIGATLIGTPYPLLIAVIIACTNVIPFFGPFLGGIPACFITLIVDPLKAVWLAVFFVVLQQFDGNVMVPLIQGDRIGVPSVWVLIGIIIGGGLFGFAGMLLAVPIFAIIYMLFKEFLEGKLRKKQLPTEGIIYSRSDTDKYVSGYVYTEEERKADEKWIEEISEKNKKPSKAKAAAEKIKEHTHKKDNK